ncbi:MAG TPA: glycerol-3-phosphate dehydrogenase [Ferrovibrio sp.]|uniref:glycerol-3-phosphate dehydrogenase n=1 Tax=Ferrovibrio sp. TaxID=1917215 RepID=UPI002ED414C4
MQSEPADLLVIGGGVNGTGIARDAAGRGLKVLLAERNDLASGTSSAATKLIHGGLRYLEQYEFRLVRESLGEREVLWHMAPHIIWPLRFVLPHHPGLRPAWMIRLGLFFYDHLSSRQTLPGSIGLDLADNDPRGLPLKPQFKCGFEYSDCWVDDARLVALNAMSARQLGATILTRTAVTAAQRVDGLWRVTLTDQESGQSSEVAARGIVNAAGPWVRETLTGAFGVNPKNAIRLVKGSHIVTRRLYQGDHCYIFQNADGRIIFAIPYEHDFTLVGTTDIAVERLDGPPKISEEETTYLLAAASEYFRQPLTRDMIVWSYAGIRPLYDDGENNPSSVTRDYVLDLSAGPSGKDTPLLSVYGGKLTTYRRLSEHVMEKIAPFYPNLGKSWTGKQPLPGGDLGGMDFDTFAEDLTRRYPQFQPAWLRRLARRHGTSVPALLGDAKATADLSDNFGGGLYAREVDWLMRQEWAREADDVLWRRTKCGLWCSAADRERLTLWMAQHRA